MKINKQNDIKSIIIVNNEANQKVVTKIINTLTNSNYQFELSNSCQDLLEQSSPVSPQLVLVSNYYNSESDFIRKYKRSNPLTEVILINNKNDTPVYSNMMRLGVYDCIRDDFTPEELTIKIERALNQSDIKQELTTLKEQVAMNYGFDNIIGQSDTITKIKETIKKISATDISILISGESGTGKELIASVIHHHSQRRKNKLVTVDFSVLPKDMIETELFGNEDDNQQSPEASLLKANDGTIYFKDIDQIPAMVQTRLLKFLNDFTLETKNGNQKVDVRIISSTSKDFKILIDSGQFSEELYYKLCEMPIQLPTLNDRKEDIEPLIDYFIRKLCLEMTQTTVNVNRDAYELLIKYSWPGNIQELENTLKRAITICRNDILTGDDIILLSSRKTDTRDSSPTFGKTILKRKSGLLDESQRTLIIKALSDNNWNFSQTAQELGIGRTTLWRKVKKYNLKKEMVAVE